MLMFLWSFGLQAQSGGIYIGAIGPMELGAGSSRESSANFRKSNHKLSGTLYMLCSLLATPPEDQHAAADSKGVCTVLRAQTSARYKVALEDQLVSWA